MKSVRIFGIPETVECEIQMLDALSGHADGEELLAWMQPMLPSLKRVFLVHGEPEQAAAMAKAIDEKFHIPAAPVAPGQSFRL